MGEINDPGKEVENNDTHATNIYTDDLIKFFKRAKISLNDKDALKKADAAYKAANAGTNYGMYLGSSILDTGSGVLRLDLLATETDTQLKARAGYDAVATTVGRLYPAAGLAMKGAEFAYDAINLMGAKNAETFAINPTTNAMIGGSYTGAMNNAVDAQSKSEGLYGLFNQKSLKRANAAITKAQDQMATMNQIADGAADYTSIMNEMHDFNALKYNGQIQGGFDLTLFRAHEGGKIELDWEPIITDPIDVNSFKQGGLIQEQEWKPIITDPIELEKGGKIDKVLETGTSLMNIIPEGALHKNKHHLEETGFDTEGITKKGIPVVDNNGELQAEIEHSEIIFSLEVTKKLEEGYKKYYSEETKNKEKELLAQDAGKLLWHEIMYNTDDRTNLIESCKEGGVLKALTGNKLLFEEWFNSIPEESKANNYDYKRAFNELPFDLLMNHAKNPKDYHLGSVSPNADLDGRIPFLKLGKVDENPEILYELDWYNSKEGKNFKETHDLQYDDKAGRYYYIPKKKLGGKL